MVVLVKRKSKKEKVTARKKTSFCFAFYFTFSLTPGRVFRKHESGGQVLGNIDFPEFARSCHGDGDARVGRVGRSHACRTKQRESSSNSLDGCSEN